MSSKKKKRNAGGAGNNAQPASQQPTRDRGQNGKIVFITTLSKINRLSTAYYYDPTDRPRYLTGAFTNEPGAKLFLSEHKADKLVVIGSKETYDHDADNSPVTLGKIDINYREGLDKVTLDYFKYSIARFVRGMDTIPEQTRPIPPERQKALLAIVNNLMKKDYPEPSEWFDVLAKNENLVKELRQRLRQSIESGYVREKTIRAFEESIKLPPLPDFSRLETGDTSVSDMIKELRAMQDEAFQTLMQREHFLLLGVTTIESRILRLEKEQLASRSEALTAAAESLEARVEAQQAVIEKLRSFVFALQKELADIRSNREQEEYAWVRQKLFEALADDRKLKAHPDGQLSAELEFVPLMHGDVSDVYNIQGIIQAIYSARSNEDEHIRIYLDMQGGDRTEAFVRSQILSLLTNELGSTVSIEKIISTAFFGPNFANAMRDETANYKISDLVSGMNAFIEYGKTGTLIKYFGNRITYLNNDQRALLNAMKAIDYAITMSDVNALEKGIENLRRSVNGQIVDDTEIGELFAVLIGGIKRDYGKLLEGERVNPIDLIEWTCRKDLIMQSLALIEARTPDILVNQKILFYPQGKENLLAEIKADKNEHKYTDSNASNNVYFIKHYYQSRSFQQQFGNAYKVFNRNYSREKLTPGPMIAEALRRKESNPGRIPLCTVLDNRYQEIGDLMDRYMNLVWTRNEVFHLLDHIPNHDITRGMILDYINKMRHLLNLAEAARNSAKPQPKPKPQPQAEPQPQA